MHVCDMVPAALSTLYLVFALFCTDTSFVYDDFLFTWYIYMYTCIIIIKIYLHNIIIEHSQISKLHNPNFCCYSDILYHLGCPLHITDLSIWRNISHWQLHHFSCIFSFYWSGRPPPPSYSSNFYYVNLPWFCIISSALRVSTFLILMG